MSTETKPFQRERERMKKRKQEKSLIRVNSLAAGNSSCRLSPSSLCSRQMAYGSELGGGSSAGAELVLKLRAEKKLLSKQLKKLKADSKAAESGMAAAQQRMHQVRRQCIEHRMLCSCSYVA